MDQPKMSDVVMMLEGDDLTERWEEWKRVEVVYHETKFASFQTF